MPFDLLVRSYKDTLTTQAILQYIHSALMSSKAENIHQNTPQCFVRQHINSEIYSLAQHTYNDCKDFFSPDFKLLEKDLSIRNI